MTDDGPELLASRNALVAKFKAFGLDTKMHACLKKPGIDELWQIYKRDLEDANKVLSKLRDEVTALEAELKAAKAATWDDKKIARLQAEVRRERKRADAAWDGSKVPDLEQQVVRLSRELSEAKAESKKHQKRAANALSTSSSAQRSEIFWRARWRKEMTPDEIAARLATRNEEQAAEIIALQEKLQRLIEDGSQAEEQQRVPTPIPLTASFAVKIGAVWPKMAALEIRGRVMATDCDTVVNMIMDEAR